MSDAIKRHFTGRSGEKAVMAEFLYRQLNVAIPEVDLGDDLFVVQSDDNTVTRVQVKTSKGTEQRNGSHFAEFNVPWDQLEEPDVPALVYVFAVRFQDRWSDFLVIRRTVLHRLQTDKGVGKITKNETARAVLKLRIVFTKDTVQVKETHSLQRFRNAFEPWPPPWEYDLETQSAFELGGRADASTERPSGREPRTARSTSSDPLESESERQRSEMAEE